MNNIVIEIDDLEENGLLGNCDEQWHCNSKSVNRVSTRQFENIPLLHGFSTTVHVRLNSH